MKQLLAALAFFSATAHAQPKPDIIDTVDGPKATGYHGLAPKDSTAELPYEGIIVNAATLPEAFDWREEGIDLPFVKNQGACGSCWAFAITGALESAEALFGEDEGLNLSEQHMVSCDDQSYGCNGGFMTSADFVVRSGLTDEASFPYKAKDLRCKTNIKVKAKAASYKLLGSRNKKPTTDEIKAALVEHGPLFVTVMAGGSGWDGSGDSVTSCRKRGSTNHMVQIVGYTKTQWIMKNSWGPKWGKDGHAFVGFGCDLIGQEAGFVSVK
jgi:C1A family cysteine protease